MCCSWLHNSTARWEANSDHLETLLATALTSTKTASEYPAGLAALRCWTLFAGYCLLDTICWILFVGYCLLDTVCWILFAGHCLLAAGCFAACCYLLFAAGCYVLLPTVGSCCSTPASTDACCVSVGCCLLIAAAYCLLCAADCYLVLATIVVGCDIVLTKVFECRSAHMELTVHSNQLLTLELLPIPQVTSKVEQNSVAVLWQV